MRKEQEIEQSPEEPLEKLPGLLTDWFCRAARPLPWRGTLDPYRIWISEIMLQQTRIETVREAYARFTERFPDLNSLAEAEETAVLKAWEGLGYYSRARNLHKTARLCRESFGGTLPGSYEELRRLPGIGEYTAGAVASIAFGENVPAVDGNVMRVLSRFLCDERDVMQESMRREMRARLRALPKEDPGLFNEALMELGEVICVPGGQPLCGLCPLGGECLARRRGLQTKLPLRAKAEEKRTEAWTVLLFCCGDRFALEKRPEKGLLSGLYGFPMLPGHASPEEAAERIRSAYETETPVPEAAGEAVHVFSHVIWRMHGLIIQSPVPVPGLRYVTAEEQSAGYPVPTAFKTYLTLIRKRLSDRAERRSDDQNAMDPHE
ncbi:MAG: A/G-specific adenine glycosylase [Lachnospiraceae bacterium]|nr:A/G-specific adenine glycosylase [Lachnospiraceae bacterium]